MKSFSFILLFSLTLSLQAQISDFDTIDFSNADATARRYKGENLKNLPVLTLLLTASLDSEVEKFRSIYYWITHNIEGDYHVTKDNEYKKKKLKDNPEAFQEWHREHKKRVFAKLRNEKKTLCTGYAYLVKEMANLAGITCEIVHGYGKMDPKKLGDLEGANHSWNMVKINGRWYVCDATWSAGRINLSNYLFTFEYDDSFFLMHPEEFAETHKPIGQQAIPVLPSQQ